MRKVAIGAVVAVALVACSSPPTFTRDDLPDLVLNEGDAPRGTTFVSGESGFLPVERFAEDETEAQALRDAGFIEGYVTIFFDPELFGEDALNPTSSLAFSFAAVFETIEGAAQGLQVVADDVRADGQDLQDYPTDGLGEESVGLYGVLEPDDPPGFLFAWRVGNAIQILVVEGAPGALNPNAVRVLAERMESRAV